MNPLKVMKRVDVLDIPFIGMSEEEMQTTPSFDLETEIRCIEEGVNAPSYVANINDPIRIDGFMDGTQRTVRWKICQTPEGARVPIFVSAIAAGILWRDKEGNPKIGYKRVWYVLIGPFAEMERDPQVTKRIAAELNALTQEDVYQNLLQLLTSQHKWIVADTSVRLGSNERLLENRELFNEGLVRNRAMGRVAHLRTYLELALLIGVRIAQENTPKSIAQVLEQNKLPDALRSIGNQDPFLLIDGPLLLTAKRRHRLQNLFSGMPGTEIERFLLRRTVGLIKTHRLHPKEPEKILNLRNGERSKVYDLTHEVDLRGYNLREEMPDDVYPSRHLTFYLRMFEKKETALFGLIRVDLHRSAVNPENQLFDNDKPLSLDERNFLDRIAAGVYRERLPQVPGRLQPAPIMLIETALHNIMPPAAVLKNLFR